MNYNGEWTDTDQLPEVLAKDFKSKVDDIINETEKMNQFIKADKNLLPVNRCLINNVKYRINSLKYKNVEGFDNILQRILRDSW
jgi:hypothetical protein